MSVLSCLLHSGWVGVGVFLGGLSPSHLLLGSERKYSAPVHHTTEHIPEKKFKSEALLSTLTSDASKENTPGKGTVAPHSLKGVCVCMP